MKEALKNYADNSLDMDPDKLMTKAGKKLFTDLDTKGEPFPPFHFV